MKLTRYKVGWHDRDFDWCKYDDVKELEAVNAELIDAAKDVIARWDSPLWKMEEHTAEFINKLRWAVTKCEGLS